MGKELILDKFIDKIEFIYCLKKRWKLITGIVLVSMSIVFTINTFAKKDLLYQSRSTVFIGKYESQGVDSVYQNADVLMYQSLVKSYEYIFRTSDLIEEAIKESKLDISVGMVKSNLQITAKEDTQIIEVVYNDKDPKVAHKFLKSLNNVFINKANYLVKNSTVEVIESPKKSNSPINNTNRIPYILGFLLTLPLSIGIAMLIERWNDYILTDDEIEKIVERPILSIVPKIDSKHGEDVIND